MGASGALVNMNEGVTARWTWLWCSAMVTALPYAARAR
jgi:hypothetical protein